MANTGYRNRCLQLRKSYLLFRRIPTIVTSAKSLSNATHPIGQYYTHRSLRYCDLDNEHCCHVFGKRRNCVSSTLRYSYLHATHSGFYRACIAKSQQSSNLISPVPDEISCAGFELSNSSSHPAAFWSEVTAMSEGIEQ